MNVNIYGHNIELQPTNNDEHITDIVILARAVRYTEDGKLEDAILIDGTEQTTGIIQAGMLHEATRHITE